MADYTYKMYAKRYSHINEACEYDPNRTATAKPAAPKTPASTPTKTAASTPTKPAASPSKPAATSTSATKNFLQGNPTELFNTEEGMSFDQEKADFERKNKVLDTNGYVKIKSEDMPYINSIANRMVDWVSSLIIFIHILFWTGCIELAMIFMHKEDALSKNVFDKVILVRRII